MKKISGSSKLLKEMGSFLRENRLKAQITQEALAQKLGLHMEAVSRWERGIRPPPKRLADFLCFLINIDKNMLDEKSQAYRAQYISERKSPKKVASGV